MPLPATTMAAAAAAISFFMLCYPCEMLILTPDGAFSPLPE
jgi:hypothetical protein